MSTSVHSLFLHCGIPQYKLLLQFCVHGIDILVCVMEGYHVFCEAETKFFKQYLHENRASESQY
jgi:hypothetical protein